MPQRKTPTTITEIFDARTPIVNAARRAVRAAIKNNSGAAKPRAASRSVKKTTARSSRRAA